MTMLPYKLDTTNDLLTSRAGLLNTAEVMDSLNMSERIDKHFPLPKSNRGYPPSKFTKIFIMMRHEGSFHLDEVAIFKMIGTVLDMKKLPQAPTLGGWFRRVGIYPQIHVAHGSLGEGQ